MRLPGAEPAGAVRIWVLFLVTQLPSLRPLFKYLREEWQILIPAYLLAWLAVYFLLLWTDWWPGFRRRVLGGRWLLVALLLGLALFNSWAYPRVDGYTKSLNRGADQDDALIVSGERLLQGANPYEARTYHGNPPSPGPGWVLAVLPFTALGAHGLLTPLAIAAIALWLWRASGSVYRANLFVLLLLSSLAAWEVMVNGSDMLAMGLVFAGSTVLVQAWWGRGAGREAVVLALVCVAATTRLVFLALVPLLALLLLSRGSRIALRFLVLGSVLALALHALFYLWNPASYTPVHVLRKGYQVLGPGLMALGAAVSLGALLLVRRGLGDRPDSWLFRLWWFLFVPLGFLGLADLALSMGKAYPLSGWEGANYLLVPLPAWLAALCWSWPLAGRTAARGAQRAVPEA